MEGGKKVVKWRIGVGKGGIGFAKHTHPNSYINTIFSSVRSHFLSEITDSCNIVVACSLCVWLVLHMVVGHIGTNCY